MKISRECKDIRRNKKIGRGEDDERFRDDNDGSVWIILQFIVFPIVVCCS